MAVTEPSYERCAKTTMLKTLGYLISGLSVVLLGTVSWKSASENPTLFAALLAGMATSIVGMLLRWLSYRQEQRDKAQIAAKAGAANRGG